MPPPPARSESDGRAAQLAAWWRAEGAGLAAVLAAVWVVGIG